MNATLTFWVVVVAVGVLNYLSRLSFIAFFARRRMPPLAARALRYVPAAMLTSIVVPAVALPPALEGAGAPVTARVVAALVAALVAWRTRSTTATICVGMVALWATQWLLAGRA